MRNQKSKIKNQNCGSGSTLVLVLIALVLLTVMGTGLLTVAYGVRLDAIRLKNEAVARLTAEAGYEQALYWMSQQQDMLSALQKGVPGTTGNLSFPDGDCAYAIELFSFAGSRPIYRIVSTGHSGVFNRTTDALVIQAVSGWDMGQCSVPSGKSSTIAVYFVNGEIIDIPIHINKQNEKTDKIDINISGSPRFLKDVGMGESRYVDGDPKKGDKYATVMRLFEGGIDFEQPDSKITDETVIQSKVSRFKDSTKTQYQFKPLSTVSPAPVSNPQPAVQLEFFVEDGVGKVRITDNCTVVGYSRDNDNKTYDFRIKSGSGGTEFERFYIYAYHLKPTSQPSIVVPLTNTYVTQSFGGVESKPGGQIFVEGNVVIGGNNTLHSNDQVFQGTVTVVAEKKSDGTGGNIWIADNVKVSDYDSLGVYHPRSSDGMPATENPNAMGLIAQGVIKVIDPGMSSYASNYSEFSSKEAGNNNYPGPPTSVPSGYEYVPVAVPVSGGAEYERYLSDQTEVEAAITVGGGGWGAENVARKYSDKYYGGRKQASGSQDDLIVRGSITEVLRGVVGVTGTDGYLKHYYLDERLLEGILPGDIWLRGKYIPAPAGWHDYRAAN